MSAASHLPGAFRFVCRLVSYKRGRKRIIQTHGNPGRVPKPSRALAPAGKARLRPRDHGNPGRVRFALRSPTRHPCPARCARPRQTLPCPGSGGQSPPSPTRSWEPWEGSLRPSVPHPPPLPRSLPPSGTSGPAPSPTTPARYARALALGLARWCAAGEGTREARDQSARPSRRAY
jgi:hypothetical protein